MKESSKFRLEPPFRLIFATAIVVFSCSIFDTQLSSSSKLQASVLNWSMVSNFCYHLAAHARYIAGVILYGNTILMSLFLQNLKLVQISILEIFLYKDKRLTGYRGVFRFILKIVVIKMFYEGRDDVAFKSLEFKFHVSIMVFNTRTRCYRTQCF